MTEAETLKLALATGSASHELKQAEGVRPHFVTAPGYKVEPVDDEALAEPWRLEQEVTVFDAESFIKYFTDYCDSASRIFVDVQAPTIVGVLDYHEPGDSAVVDNKPRWGQHRLTYQFRPTPEWTVWSGADRRNMPQVEFATFIEDNLPDISRPAHAEMLEISRTMVAKKNVNFSSGVRLQNGEVQLSYQEEIRGSAAQGTIEIPETFAIRETPFEGSDEYSVEIRLRYFIRENHLVMRYELIRPHKIVEAAVNKVVETISGGVDNAITRGVLG